MNMASSSSSSFSASTATAGAAASASAISPQEKHEVFLSFRGEDTRNGFTSYLYDGLCRKQILTYMDDHQLERGDEISPTLLKAIKESKISVIIFSENFASSTWCLDEVVKILECKKKNRQTVIPIFYDIEPSVVRKQEESYAEAFAKLEERFKDNMDKVQQWRHALNEAAGLKGFNSMQFRPENTLIQKIVEDISLLLHKYPSSYEQFKGLIGIEKRIEEIESLICIRSMDVRIIGIWGMGGIGKTTLASAIFQKFSYSHFEGYCFLWNVKEESARHGLHHLREKLLGELLKDEAIVCKATSFVQSTYIRDRLRCKKEMGWAIVRDEHKLPGNRSRLWIAEDVCHVLERDTGTATIEGILFNMSKVKKDVKVSPTAFSNMYNLRFLKIYCDKIKNEDSNCKLCLPQGLDSYLSDRLRYFHWDLYPLKHLPSNFTPENLVVLILRGSQLELLWNEAHPLAKLKEIDLSYSKFLTQMPNLSQALNLESINIRGCIRLFQVPSYFKNLHKLQFIDLTGCTDLVDVEGILGRTEYLDNENYGEIIQRNKSFQKLKMNLRQLKLCGTAIEEIPSSIGCLFGLIELDLGDCKRLKSLPTSICKLKSLKSLNLSHCLKLEKFPEILEPMGCLKLVILSQAMIEELPESIENLIGLEELFLSDCKNIGFFPKKFCKLSHLKVLFLHGCSKLQKLLLPLGLCDLRLAYCVSLKSISQFPPFLQTLDASFCTSLEKIPCWNSRIKHNFLMKRHGLVDFSLLAEFINFSNCLKVDCSTRNIIAHYASLNIWFRARSRQPFVPYRAPSKADICYPGDEIPNWFSYQTLGDSISVTLPDDWCNTNFLGFAPAIVLELNSAQPNTFIEYEFNFKTINMKCSLFSRQDISLCSEHVVMLYGDRLSREIEQEFGQNWSSIFRKITEVSFHARILLFDDNFSDFVLEDDEQCKIKKCGIWFIYEDDAKQLMDFGQPKVGTQNKKRF